MKLYIVLTKQNSERKKQTVPLIGYYYRILLDIGLILSMLKYVFFNV